MHGRGSTVPVLTTIRYAIAASVTTGHLASGIASVAKEREREERGEEG
jgi:hypothetical protein